MIFYTNRRDFMLVIERMWPELEWTWTCKLDYVSTSGTSCNCCRFSVFWSFSICIYSNYLEILHNITFYTKSSKILVSNSLIKVKQENPTKTVLSSTSPSIYVFYYSVMALYCSPQHCCSHIRSCTKKIR